MRRGLREAEGRAPRAVVGRCNCSLRQNSRGLRGMTPWSWAGGSGLSTRAGSGRSLHRTMDIKPLGPPILANSSPGQICQKRNNSRIPRSFLFPVNVDNQQSSVGYLWRRSSHNRVWCATCLGWSFSRVVCWTMLILYGQM